MARQPKLSHCEAKTLLKQQGVDLKKDFFELDGHDVGLVVDAAKRTGYRKSRNAPGSTGRMYFSLLQRQKKCR
jgi:hypothetical protein